MHAKTHATLARLLIKACGGLEQAAENCRLEKSRLQEFQDPDTGAFMPADVMADLEGYAGEPIYSAAIAKERPSAPTPKGLLEEAMETAEAGVDLQRLLRTALDDGRIDKAEDLKIEAQLLAIEEQVREVRAAKSRAMRGEGEPS